MTVQAFCLAFLGSGKDIAVTKTTQGHAVPREPLSPFSFAPKWRPMGLKLS